MHSFHLLSKTAITHPHSIPLDKRMRIVFHNHKTQYGHRFFENLVFDQQQAKSSQLTALLQNNPYINEFLNMFSSITFLLDIKRNTYTYLSTNIENILGYSLNDLQKSELTANTALIHPEDSHHIQSLTTQLLKRLKKIPLQQMGDYTLNREFRLLRKDGSILQMFEQSKVVETGKKGDVLSIFGQLTDISILKKKQGTAVYLTSAFNEEKIDFSPKKSCSILSNRELQVMELLSKGLSSKQIAHMLSISPYTVGKHRQKMLAKTQSKNSSELIHFAEHHQLV